MFIEIICSLLFGIILGIITGLIPGVHINLISIIILTYSPVFLTYINIYSIAVIIISMSITHTFLDSIPGIYLGAPDESTALNVLPGHRLLIQGKGHCALIYTLIGSYSALVLSIILFYFFGKAMLVIQPTIKEVIGYVLIIVIMLLIWKDQKSFHALLCFFISGLLGIIVLNIHTLNQPLFPLLSGLFGLSILIVSLMESNNMPNQKKSTLNLPAKIIVKTSLGSTLVGFVAAFLPGFGSSQAAIVAQQFIGDIGDEGFLALVGGINTANMLISLATAFFLEKARNGAVLAMLEIVKILTVDLTILLIIIALISGSIAFVLGIGISKFFCYFIQKINYKFLLISIIFFIIILTFIFDNFLGLIVLFTSTFVGIFTSKIGVGKNHLMGCLILPVILFFIF